MQSTIFSPILLSMERLNNSPIVLQLIRWSWDANPDSLGFKDMLLTTTLDSQGTQEII